MNIFAISGWAIGLAGLLCSVYYGRKAEALKKDLKIFSWAEIRAGTDHLASQIRRDGAPDAFLATDSRGGLIAKLIGEKMGGPVPVYVGTCFDSRDSHPGSLTGFFRIDTDRWHYFLPDVLSSLRKNNLILVDDVAFSGETIAHIRRKLREYGFDNLKVATLLTSEIASRQQIGPDWFWRKTLFTEMMFPWGRMQ